jgi:hypothetical protein
MSKRRRTGISMAELEVATRDAIGSPAPFSWDQVDTLRPVAVKPVAGFTTREYAQRYGLPYRTAADQIGKMLDAGKLSRQMVVISGHPSNVYFVLEPSAAPSKKTK